MPYQVRDVKDLGLGLFKTYFLYKQLAQGDCILFKNLQFNLDKRERFL